MIITVLIFLAVLFVLVLVHEWGHYITAKLTGMRVDEFAIGFPPKFLSWKKGETTYSLNALPIGGFVRIYGEDLTEAITASADSHRAFGARPKWAQAVVLVAGVTMNVLFAYLLFVFMLTVGVPTQVEENAATAAAKLTVAGVLPHSPADGVIAPNTVITGVSAGTDSIVKPAPSVFSDFIAAHADVPVTVTTLKNNVAGSVTVTPVKGLITASPDRAALGVSLSFVEVVSRPFGSALVEAGHQVVEATTNIVVGLFDLIHKAVVGKADFKQVAGPIGIVKYVGDAAAVGFMSVLYFTAIISLNLAVINLLPIPALDGGRLVFVAIEAVTRRPIPPIWAARVNTAGFIFLMLLMVAATAHDIFKMF
jgi:regulator of sigma E protease